MPSFDVVSKVDLMELDNALNTAQKELAQRYDFRGTNTTIERTPEGILLRTADEPHATAAVQVLRERMAKRNVSQRCLDVGEPEPAAGRTVRLLIKIKQGIEVETGKKIVKAIKDSKIKVQARSRATRCASPARTATTCRGPSPCCGARTSAWICSS